MNKNDWFYKILVLFGIVRNPSMNPWTCMTKKEHREFRKGFEDGINKPCPELTKACKDEVERIQKELRQSGIQ